MTGEWNRYICTFRDDDFYDVRIYEFGSGHFWHGPEIVDENIIAWMNDGIWKTDIRVPHPFRVDAWMPLPEAQACQNT